MGMKNNSNRNQALHDLGGTARVLFTNTRILFFALSIVLCCGFLGCEGTGGGGLTREQYRQAATALYEKELYAETIHMYRQYLNSPVISQEEAPKVLYQMGNLYLEKLKDPEKALAQYTLIQSLYPDETFNQNLGKKMVACLERMGRRTDAKQTLGTLTRLNERDRDSVSGKTVVAEVDGQKITLNDIEALGPLPESPLEKNQAIQQFVVQILIAESARRKGLANTPEFKRKIKFIEDQVLARENLQEELKIDPPTEKDLRYFYEAHKQKYAEGPDSLGTFETAQEKVLTDWQAEKRMEKYQSYVQDLLQSDRVKIYGVSGE